MSVAKTCAHCGADFTRRRDEDKTRYEKRKCCSTECSYAFQRARHASKRLEMPTKPCLECGKPVAIREGEWASTYKKRKFCSQECANANNGKLLRERNLAAAAAAATAAVVPKPAKRRLKRLRFVDRLEPGIRSVFLQAVMDHPEFLGILARGRDYDFSEELRAGDFLRTTR